MAATAGLTLITGVFTSALFAAETLPKAILIQMSLNQASVLCKSEPFTQCMGFSETECMGLADQSVATCLAPLPDEIDLTLLQNSTLEECPQQVYREAGHSEEKAQECLEAAIEAFDEQQSAAPIKPDAPDSGSEQENVAGTKESDDTDKPSDDGGSQQSEGSAAVKSDSQSGSD